MGIAELARAAERLRIDAERPLVRGDYDGWARLTRAERETASLAAKGLSNRGIAQHRGTALRTVANQLAAAYRKLRIAGRRELCALCRWAGPQEPSSALQRSDTEIPIERALTLREQQILTYAEIGHSNKLIAYSLGVSISTVSTLLARARRKLGLQVCARAPRQYVPRHSMSAN